MHTPRSFSQSAYLLRERCAVRICLVLIKKQQGMWRTTLLVVVLKCSPQQKELSRSAPLTLATDWCTASDWSMQTLSKPSCWFLSHSVCGDSVYHMEQRRKGKSLPSLSSGQHHLQRQWQISLASQSYREPWGVVGENWFCEEPSRDCSSVLLLCCETLTSHVSSKTCILF